MPDLSILTSLYRSDPHLPGYSRHLLDALAQLSSAGISPEVMIVANDPSEQEKRLLEDLCAADARIRVMHVALETVYASWNRAVRASGAPYFGMWNVDDVHFPAAMIAGVEAMKNGADLVDFPHEIVTHKRDLLGRQAISRRMYPVMVNPEHFGRKAVLGPFFMAARSLYDRVGPFDESFAVCGDLDWTARVMPVARFSAQTIPAGEFHIHGGNLSNTDTVREHIEINLIFMRRGEWSQVFPTRDPESMRKKWQECGDSSIELPDSVQEMLWGPDAARIGQRWFAQRIRHRQRLALKTFLKRFVPQKWLSMRERSAQV